VTSFQVGTVYTARAASDHATIYYWRVMKRSARFVSMQDRWGDERRVAITIADDGTELAILGRYANAPVLRADRHE
jgi:hypothetical protein